MNYLIIIPIAFILAAAALALPWFMVRQGYREQVQLGGACTTVLGLAASTGVFSYADNMPLALLYGSASVVSFLYALDCFLPLYLSRKSH
ncbi:cobalamin biosynthesis protein CbiX [Salmonella enterica]|jgi:hypothetical protein|uniref:Cobalamin biosynthesis protein CbiX n=9 Tax=Enterobacterales TaxID=91347 RepID=A0A2I8SUP4_ECOLX|nr:MULTISPECIES: hypothetical protein [Enterobacteriaceae]AVO98820.1 cobalamin biosynthesis protein CbiX [Klebsiella pneumoniae subsp. ozaenae]EBR8912881.1 cobalamin biosynthesis protein CbiX [Salmonella enterica subsp. enterica serovar Enteritidis]EBS2357560.1 cobalamin biosynthesis protein CbiX [Salmonella enterica subsp. enterica serovar Muenchen]EBW4004052.1 cobalamin biosynthesis protein CbiX [Salmonella enterica subsp. enterica serovar Thompson]ECA0739552.1 cobalamin biosynthesis protein